MTDTTEAPPRYVVRPTNHGYAVLRRETKGMSTVQVWPNHRDAEAHAAELEEKGAVSK